MLTTHHYRNVRTWAAAGMRDHGIRWLMQDTGLCDIRAENAFDDIASNERWTHPELTAYKSAWDVPAFLSR